MASLGAGRHCLLVNGQDNLDKFPGLGNCLAIQMTLTLNLLNFNYEIKYYI